MPVSLSNAKAAIQSINSTGSGLFDLLKRNITFHDDSHWSYENAQAAIGAGKAVCGYYFKDSFKTAYEHNTSGARKDRLSRRDKKSQYKRIQVNQKLPVTAMDCSNIVVAALNASKSASYKQSSTPNSRFLYIVEIPDGYGGETLKRNGSSSACPYVVLVVTTGTNYQLTTHFPCDQAYYDRFSDLT
ncbi:MAG: hypothetical protein HKN70_07065 [Gammaproteobacteria bacterium]|nr:hypothetical protein [Gammaproteobacteria bacterium]